MVFAVLLLLGPCVPVAVAAAGSGRATAEGGAAAPPTLWVWKGHSNDMTALTAVGLLNRRPLDSSSASAARGPPSAFALGLSGRNDEKWLADNKDKVEGLRVSFS